MISKFESQLQEEISLQKSILEKQSELNKQRDTSYAKKKLLEKIVSNELKIKVIQSENDTLISKLNPNSEFEIQLELDPETPPGAFTMEELEDILNAPITTPQQSPKIQVCPDAPARPTHAQKSPAITVPSKNSKLKRKQPLSAEFVIDSDEEDGELKEPKTKITRIIYGSNCTQCSKEFTRKCKTCRSWVCKFCDGGVCVKGCKLV